MALIIESVILEYLIGLALGLYLLHWWYNNNNSYWDNKGVPCRKMGFLIQSLLGTQSQQEMVKELYKSIENEPFFGFFQLKSPAIVLRDPELIKKIMVKDFIHFQDRPFPSGKRDAFSSSLFSLKGQIWRTLRYKLTPTFTSGKIKGMFDQVSQCGNNMVARLEELSKENADVETKSFLFEFTSDVISSCAFGLQFKPGSPECEEFKSKVQNIFNGSVLVLLKVCVLLLFPRIAAYFNLNLFTSDRDYFLNLVKANMKYRKDNNIKRNDYFQLLLTLKEQEESGKDMGLNTTDSNEEDAVVNQMKFTEQTEVLPTSEVKLFTDDVICANSFIFLVAGSESVSSTISMILFELSRHPGIQQTLQQEVDTVLARYGDWTYEAVRDMSYLDQVVQEAQRLYPVLPMLSRECVEPYKIPDTDIVIEKGLQVLIPVIGIHMDPQYYPDPETFKPERFVDNNFKQGPTYMPFGDGPRICIALRFAAMEVKTCVARIMAQYSVKLSAKTQLPLQFEPRSAFPFVKGGLWLCFEKRKEISM